MSSHKIIPPENVPSDETNLLDEHVITCNLDVTEGITSFEKLFNEFILQMVSACPSFSSVPSDEITGEKFGVAIFIVIIGAFSAYLFNYFHWRMVDRKQKYLKVCTLLDDLIVELESMSINYWLQVPNAHRQAEIHADEIKIKSITLLIPRYVGIIVPKIKSNKMQSNKEKLEQFPANIFDLVTGDGFESAREASKSKAKQISRLCSDIRATISLLEFDL